MHLYLNTDHISTLGLIDIYSELMKEMNDEELEELLRITRPNVLGMIRLAQDVLERRLKSESNDYSWQHSRDDEGDHDDYYEDWDIPF